jgi:hypothetical protein
MGTIDVNEIVGLIDSNKGEIICRDCLKDEELSIFADEEAITRDKIAGDDVYYCDRCKKRL